MAVGGGSVEKKELDTWIERLKAEGDGKKRQSIVSELCKAHGLKIGEARELLKEAGYGVEPEAGKEGGGTPLPEEGNAPKSESPQDGAGKDPPPATEEKIRVTLRHKTEYPRYRRAGLAIAQIPATYNVTESQLARLKKDPWVVIEKDGGGK